MLLLERDVLRVLCALCVRYNHHTDVLFPHAEGAEDAKILLYNAIAGEVAGYARQECAEVGENQWLYSIFVCHPTSALSRRSETCDISSVSVNSMEIIALCSLRPLREVLITIRMFLFLFLFVSRFPFVFAYLP